MPSVPPEPLCMAARVERALLLLAYCIELDGDVHVPLYERLEAELQRLQRVEDTRARARRRLADYSGRAPVKAIDSKNLISSFSDGASLPPEL